MRNENIEKAVDLLIEKIDDISRGVEPPVPTASKLKSLFDQVKVQSGSVRLACAFFVSYSYIDHTWDFKTVPVGIRGKYGDKRLSVALTSRHVTFHNSVTAFGENLGTKGNVRNFVLSTDPRFSGFLTGLSKLTIEERKSLVNHVAWVIHSSIVLPKALPDLPRNYLTYARSLNLCEILLEIHSEGHIQQFLVAAFLEIHRKRFGHRVLTHHPHASDKFDRTKGDIEEFRDYGLVAAYEVTVRDDWKNRLTDFETKMREAGLHKYVIFASNVRSDVQLRPAKNLIDYVDKLGYDLAIVDILDFFSVFCAELTNEELVSAFNRAYQLLSDPDLSGRSDFMEKYRAATNEWLDSRRF